MNKLHVKCIQCGKEWTKDSVIRWGPNDISSSLCGSCFIEVISPIICRKQLNKATSIASARQMYTAINRNASIYDGASVKKGLNKHKE